jgi:hypothetical protein
MRKVNGSTKEERRVAGVEARRQGKLDWMEYIADNI